MLSWIGIYLFSLLLQRRAAKPAESWEEQKPCRLDADVQPQVHEELTCGPLEAVLYSSLGQYIYITLPSGGMAHYFASGYLIWIGGDFLRLLHLIPQYWYGKGYMVPVHVDIPIDRIVAITHPMGRRWSH
jgi:hypothetical protein